MLSTLFLINNRDSNNKRVLKSRQFLRVLQFGCIFLSLKSLKLHKSCCAKLRSLRVTCNDFKTF